MSSIGYNRYMGKNITFVSMIEGLESIDECLPKPAKHFIPQWFRDIPNSIPNTVKICPSFPDYFSQGYVIPMWSDVKLKYDKESLEWQYEAPNNFSEFDLHHNTQFTDYVLPSFKGVSGSAVFKARSPWRIITPPGWSVLQLPLFYHFNSDWSVLPGIIDTDIHNEVNQQILYHGNDDSITINRGDPLALYIPFERKSKLEFDVRYQTQEDMKMFNSKDFQFRTKLKPSGVYRNLQRKRDKGNG